jgi:hypothetical protein
VYRPNVDIEAKFHEDCNSCETVENLPIVRPAGIGMAGSRFFAQRRDSCLEFAA